MTETSSPESADALTNADTRSREMLTATRRLLDADTVADEREVLAASVVQVLAPGPIAAPDILQAVNELWPAAGISIERVNRALLDAEASGLAIRAGDKWALSADAIEDNSAAEQWYTDAMGRLAQQIQARAAADVGAVGLETAQIWARLLMMALVAGIGAEEGSFNGLVGVGAAGELRPISLEGRAILDSIRSIDTAPETKDFLAACALAAVDEADPFANEIVSCVATGCVLHSVAARRAGASARSALGELSTRRVIVDTNVLFVLLGPSQSSNHFRSIITQATSAGMEVIVPAHVLEELRDVVDRVGAAHIPGLLDSLSRGVSSKIYMQAVSETSLADFLAATEEGTYRSWSDYTDRVADLPTELGGLGAVVRSAMNPDTQRVERIAAVLENEITSGGGGRGETPILRDAESLEMVWRKRRQRAEELLGKWPAGWILSTDTKLDPTYRRLEPGDQVGIALRPAQLATLLVQAAPEPQVSELVEAATSFVRHDAMMTMAMRYPPQTALALAQGLASEDFSATDQRIAQTSFTELIELVADEGVSGDQITSYVVRRRAKRSAAAQNRQRDIVKKQTEALSEGLLLAQERTRIEGDERRRAEERAKLDQNELDRLRTLEKEHPKALRRVVVLGSIVTAALLLGVILMIGGFFFTGLGFVTGGIVVLATAWSWAAEGKRSAWVLLWGLVPQVLSVLEVFRGLVSF